ncbi:MAG UNVERIFIED_CONTAM: hypothetical protein LVR29_00365 [Microcystis novacekii LVE1205-3]
MLNSILEPRGGEHQTIRAFFEPKTIAVVGFNRQNPQLDRTLLHNLHHNPGQRRLYLVNPHPENRLNLPTYSSLPDMQAAIESGNYHRPCSRNSRYYRPICRKTG